MAIVIRKNVMAYAVAAVTVSVVAWWAIATGVGQIQGVYEVRSPDGTQSSTVVIVAEADGMLSVFLVDGNGMLEKCGFPHTEPQEGKQTVEITRSLGGQHTDMGMFFFEKGLFSVEICRSSLFPSERIPERMPAKRRLDPFFVREMLKRAREEI